MAAILEQAGRSLAEACELVDPADLCVENLETTSLDGFLPIVERYGASICLDVGHLAWEGDTPADFLARHGKRVREVHLHDAASAPPGSGLRVHDHLALGQGSIDYDSFLRHLKDAGFDGAVILENNTREDLEESLKRISSFL
jgi:sugar phosphate isomerase/epimerase